MKKILNIGSINLDHVYRVPHFVQPGETLSSLSLTDFAGGKGLNQSIALARAGGNVYHAGKVGPDGSGLIQILKDSGVDISLLATDGTTTGHTVIQVNDKGQNCIILYPGANFELDQPYIDKALDGFGPGDILVLQNEVNNLPYIMEAAHSRGMDIAFNPSPINSAIEDCPLNYVTWFLLNEIEGAALGGTSDPNKILAAMADRFPGAAIVLTVGKGGVYYQHQGAVLHHGIYDVPVVDTTAAGDTFTGYFISLLAGGAPPEKALELASIASSLAVSRSGASASIPTLEEVKTSGLKPINNGGAN